MTTDKNCSETALKGAYESREIQPLLHGLQEEPIGNILEVMQPQAALLGRCWWLSRDKTLECCRADAGKKPAPARRHVTSGS